MGVSRDDAARHWRTFAPHAQLALGGGPAPSFASSDRWFLASSGSPHVDLNQAALFGDAGHADATTLVSAVATADVPVLLGCSQTTGREVDAPLSAAGFVELPSSERLFRMAGAPTAALALPESPFDVRMVRTRQDVAAMQAMFLEVHHYEHQLTNQLYGRLPERSDMTGWLAWDGDEAVSFAIVTQVKASLSLFEVMTPVRHRRRGAARAVVVGALARVAAAAGRPISEVLFWSSPAGQALYESLGFEVVDTIRAWTRGASEADLAAVGAG